MLNLVQIRLSITDPDLKVRLESALNSQGFKVHLRQIDGNLEILNDNYEVFVLDRSEVKKLLTPKPQSKVITVGDVLELHTLNYEANCKGQRLNLTSSEFQMLKVLCENRPQVMTRERLVEIFTALGLDLSLRTIDNHIFNLRKKLGECEHLIQTIRGVGYKVRDN